MITHKKPLEVGDRVTFPGDPSDRGTVVEVHRVVTQKATEFLPERSHDQVVILWDRGQHMHEHQGWCGLTSRSRGLWKRHVCIMPDIDEVRADTGALVTLGAGRVRRLPERVGTLAAERDLARAKRRFDADAEVTGG